MSSQLLKLATPFPERYIEKSPQGASYVAHHVVNQALLATVGPFDFEVVEILRGYVPEQTFKKGKPDEYTKPPIESAIVGVVCRLTCEIDGRTTRIEEVGDVEHPQNWGQDGARLKDAVSDSLKRCAARIGLGGHLWSQEHFFLHESLLRRERTERDGPANDQRADLIETLRSTYPPHVLDRACSIRDVLNLEALSLVEVQQVQAELAQGVIANA